MPHPKFIQISAGDGQKCFALAENGSVWGWNSWYSPDHATAPWCWTELKDNYLDIFPPPAPPKPTFEACIFSPPTFEEEAEREVNAMLNEVTK